ncbi:LacI family DNA-binding transcriptional regulator [Chelativorans intermedius]|uniref:LacI family DNA-binding transcriptional regulator n=1 Tax=Chelativorans intermedius TaxID=515947 RepID=A0ABV6D7P9_9HYPH|nr:LacI family DNA-binding transcriptional regulator [Chelativorans intermedius]MCT8999768.1 LacI family DNA-binding transcriptional regulator [Chelativorans intermedius]
MDRKTPRIQDVARAAGVSTATVSRAISNPSVVSEATRNAVFEAIRSTGYQINLTARNLRQRRTRAIVVLVPNLGNPFFSHILAGIEQVAASAGFSVLIVDTKQPHANEGQLFTYLSSSRADGLIVLDGSLPVALFERRGTAGGLPPVVFACEWIAGSPFSKVMIDNAAGAAMAIRHLHGLGHRCIGHVSGPRGNVLTDTRLQGTRAALAELGLPVRREWFFDGDFSLQSGAEAARAWLALDERPTAVFCASDQMACGFISQLSMEGYTVPRDVSVVGFDDIDIARHFIPPLTTVRQPRNAIGAAAARLLIAQMGAGTADAPPVEEVLAVELAARRSAAPPGPAAG